MNMSIWAGAFVFLERKDKRKFPSLLCVQVRVCVPVPERKVRGLLCSVFYCAPACNWARLLIAVAAVGGAVGAARHPAAVSWEAGSQGRSWSSPQGPWGPANCHLFLLMLHTWGSRHCSHAPPPPNPTLPDNPLSPPSLLPPHLPFQPRTRPPLWHYTVHNVCL